MRIDLILLMAGLASGGVTIGYCTALLTYGRRNKARRVSLLSFISGIAGVAVSLFLAIVVFMGDPLFLVLSIPGAVVAQLPAWWLARRVPQCPNCGLRQSSKHAFCLDCGQALTVDATQSTGQRVPEPGHGWGWRLTLLVGSLLFVAGFVGFTVVYTPPATYRSEPPPGYPAVVVWPTATPVPMVEIVVAAQELPRGLLIPAENAVTLRPWPANSVPLNALLDVEDVIGKIALTDIPREAPVLADMIGESVYQLHPVNFPENPLPMLPRGRLSTGSVVYGILNTENPMEEWVFPAQAGGTVTFVLSDNDIRHTLDYPALTVWADDTEAWIEGRRVMRDSATALTVTFPRNAVYIVVAGRGRLASGYGGGVYRLSVQEGEVELPLADLVLMPTPTFAPGRYPY